MMLYTIGHTQSSAEYFFERLRRNHVEILLDIRLKNKSQLAGFARYPDIEWFVRELCGIQYLHDDFLSPTEDFLKAYQKGEIDWDGYEVQFHDLMRRRNIIEYLRNHYAPLMEKNICLLCSEPTPERCHRRLVADYFRQAFGCEISHL